MQLTFNLSLWKFNLKIIVISMPFQVSFNLPFLWTVRVEFKSNERKQNWKLAYGEIAADGFT